MSKRAAMPEGFTQSSGNIFADLKRDNPAVHKIKADLALRLNKLLDRASCSQQELARYLGLQQPHVSQLRNYRLKGFSVERLMELLVKMGVQVEIQVGESPCLSPELCVVNPVPTQFVVIPERSGWKDLDAPPLSVGNKRDSFPPLREASGEEVLQTFHKSHWTTMQ
jgi:predicted XRE-type DNA-binding protein